MADTILKLPEYMRFPVIALDFDRKDEAIAKELVINYASGDIYIASPNDPTQLIDVTNTIKEKIANMQGNDINITIAGIGQIKLSKIIIKLINTLDNSIDAELGNDAFDYKEFPATIDSKSINLREDGIVQIRNFDQAPVNGVLTKNDAGGADWKTIPQLIQDTETGSGNDPNNSDGIQETVPSIEATNNDKLYLRTNTRQKTVNPQQTRLYVILPNIVDDYARIDWMLKLGNNVPTFVFPSNAIFEYSGYNQPITGNNVFKYMFETYDNGVTWLCTYKPFNKDIATSDANDVKIDYLQANYYNKTEIDTISSWNVQK